jgi:DNA polymerase-4
MAQEGGAEGEAGHRSLCRDCLARFDGQRRRCPSCGSPRVVCHPELDRLAIAHVDCDAFYASVEKRDDPSLADRPVIVGGGRRGVVSTCCYVARTFGVRSAMPMFKALKACPDAVVIKPDMEKYVRVGRQIRGMMTALTPLVEPLSIDEAFLDLSGTEALHRASPAETLARFAKRVEAEVGVTVSVGLAPNKFLAKIASDLDKPRGFAAIGAAEARDFLAGQPVGILPGIGKVAQQRLARDGITGIVDLQARAASDLARLYGEEGLRLWRLAQGIDTRRVEPDHDAKSVSAETTFDEDIGDLDKLVPVLLRLSEKVSARMKKAGIAGSSVTLKLKTVDFRIRTRARSGLPPTQLASRIFAVARDLLAAEADGTRFRLIGVGMSDLGPADGADRGDLVDTGVRRTAEMERAIDALRDRFGARAVERGLVWDARRGSK